MRVVRDLGGTGKWPVLIIAGPVMITVRGTHYQFAIRIGRVIDLAVWERK
jgi:hypothetical protein